MLLINNSIEFILTPQHRGRIRVSHWEGGAALRVGQFGHFLRFSAYEPEQKVTLWAPPGEYRTCTGSPPPHTTGHVGRATSRVIKVNMSEMTLN